MKKRAVLPVILLFLIGCANSYSVTKRNLKCRFRMRNGFSISKISVSKIGDNGMPLIYTTDTTVECTQNFCAGPRELQEKLTQEEYNQYQSSSDTIDLITKRNIKDHVLKIAELNSTDFENYFRAEHIKDSIIKLRFPFHPKRKIHFNRENKNYKWFFSEPFVGETTYSFPIEFQKNSWYKISDLSGYGFFTTNCDFFIYIDNKGKMHRWHTCDPWSPV